MRGFVEKLFIHTKNKETKNLHCYCFGGFLLSPVCARAFRLERGVVWRVQLEHGQNKREKIYFFERCPNVEGVQDTPNYGLLIA